MGCVYEIIFPNGKSYVGMTRGCISERMRSHCKLAFSRGTKAYRKSVVHKAIRLHDLDDIKVRILFWSDSEKLLLKAERQEIAQRGTIVPNGYNLAQGGEGSAGFRFSEESLQRLRRRHREVRVERPEWGQRHAQFMRDWSKNNPDALKARNEKGNRARIANSPVRNAVLGMLRQGPHSYHELAAGGGKSRAHVQSMIYTLRKEGYEIRSTGHAGRLGQYVLVKEPDTNVP